MNETVLAIAEVVGIFSVLGIGVWAGLAVAPHVRSAACSEALDRSAEEYALAKVETALWRGHCHWMATQFAHCAGRPLAGSVALADQVVAGFDDQVRDTLTKVRSEMED